MIIRKLFLLTAFLVISQLTQAQSKGSFLLGVGMDLYRTDNTGFAERSQVGLEGNYFFSSQFSGTVGFDFWSGRQTFFVLGGRFYPVDPVFIKLKGLIGDNSDVALGMGYQRGIGGNFNFEGGMDFYFDPGDLGIRLGLSYLF
ncbi:hypothetical protein QQ020_29490 [Fulvivirgaceae bacterium BMA12]|uniref:Outer membrane protein beta-barrel domain-containing protein n=1 Tax=Agaribacillus aureus TaxID=3051825 RepID=A0ABT8LEM9_9BACT|nr:hypothetical protein [Fulvivirgaceae bacterium BMA12]